MVTLLDGDDDDDDDEDDEGDSEAGVLVLAAEDYAPFVDGPAPQAAYLASYPLWSLMRLYRQGLDTMGHRNDGLWAGSCVSVVSTAMVRQGARAGRTR